MKRLLVLGVIAAVVLVGCQNKPVPKKAAAPASAPPPTAAEIEREVMTALAPMRQLLNPQFVQVSPEVSGQMVAAVRAAKTKHQGSENGPEALAKVAVFLEDYVQQAERMKLWQQVLLGCDALEVLDPNNSRLERARAKAAIEINRPMVSITGGVEDPSGGAVTMFLNVYLPETGETVSVRVREGEEFLQGASTLRLVQVIGDRKGAVFEYVAAGETFEVYQGEGQPLGGVYVPPALQRDQGSATTVRGTVERCRASARQE